MLLTEALAGALGALKARVEDLEKANGRLRWQLGAAVVGFVILGLLVAGVDIAVRAADISNQAAAFGGGGGDIPNLIEARAFHVVADDGTVLVKLDDSVGMGLGLFGSIATFTSGGHQLTGIGMTTAGAGRIVTQNLNGETVVEISASEEDASGGIAIYDATGQAMIHAGSTGSGGMILVGNRRIDNAVMLTALAADGGGTITINSGAGESVMIAGSSPSGAGVVIVLDPLGGKESATLIPGL